MNEALKRETHEADPGEEYMDEIIEAIDWWAELLRPFHSRQGESAISSPRRTVTG